MKVIFISWLRKDQFSKKLIKEGFFGSSMMQKSTEVNHPRSIASAANRLEQMKNINRFFFLFSGTLWLTGRNCKVTPQSKQDDTATITTDSLKHRPMIGSDIGLDGFSFFFLDPII